MTVSAKIIADSINANKVRITTFELIYPRIIHSELMTHRTFSRNAASSRAIPVNTMLDLIEQNPAMPVHWGKNQAGMQADQELDEQSKLSVQGLWLNACKDAVSHARVMADIGAHKQVINRITEPYQHMKVVLTATEYNNWYWLRDHKDADPTIHELARVMNKAKDESVPNKLKEGQWHLPYVQVGYVEDKFTYFDEEFNELTLEQALMISASCCAQVSYRKNDGSLEKAEVVFKRLIESKPCHASPTEHQAKCIQTSLATGIFTRWPEGFTHLDRDGNFWSGNFKDWVQYRQLLKDNVVKG